jgi:hypothetical protein
MTGPLIISMLSKKYAQLLGEQEFAYRTVEDANGLKEIVAATQRADERKRQIDDILASIETVVWLYDPKWDPSGLRPLAPRKKHWTPSTISRAALKILREAGEPLTTTQITHRIAVRLGLPKFEGREINRINTAVNTTLNQRVGSTILRSNESPIRWSIIPRDEVRPRRKRKTKAPTLRPMLEAAE